MRDNSSHIVIIFLLTLITLNLFILDLKVFSPASSIQLSDISTVATPIPITNNQSRPSGIRDAVITYPSQTASGQPTTNNLSCPNSCISLIKEATESSRIGSDLQPITNNQQLTTSHEYYIPLGGGNTDKSDWTDLTATETVIDPQNYGNIKEGYFIASLSNPTQNGQIEARLFNVTDKHMVWGSHVIIAGPKSQTITSDKINLDTGNKLYRVQMRSSLGYPGILDNAKIRIVTEQ